MDFKLINIARTMKTDVNYDFVTSFWRTKAVVTSHFAVGTLADFLAKARLLGKTESNEQFRKSSFIKKENESKITLTQKTQWPKLT